MDDRRRLAVVGADLRTKMLVLENCSGAFEVEPVESRPDLVAHLRQQPPAVLLLDADLPHLDASRALWPAAERPRRAASDWAPC